MSTILDSQVRKQGLGREKNTLPDPPKEERRVWECENKQLDPEMKIMSTILDSQARKPGLEKEKIRSQTRLRKKTRSRERKIRAQTRSRKKNGFGEKKIYSQTCEAQDSIRFPSPPVSSPWLFVTRHNS